MTALQPIDVMCLKTHFELVVVVVVVVVDIIIIGCCVSFISIAKLKHQISMLVPIPPEDQVLLYGPPYKVLDKVVRPLH